MGERLSVRKILALLGLVVLAPTVLAWGVVWRLGNRLDLELARLTVALGRFARFQRRMPNLDRLEAMLALPAPRWREVSPKPCAECGGTGVVRDGGATSDVLRLCSCPAAGVVSVVTSCLAREPQR